MHVEVELSNAVEKAIGVFDQAFYFFLFASIAARTFGGDIGKSVSRVPTARSIALAIAAIGGQMLTSAAPLAPYGWLGLATSTITGSIIGRSDDTGIR